MLATGAVAQERDPAVSTAWIHGRTVDLVVAWAWIPFFAVTTVLHGDALVTWTGIVLLISFAHQPLTFPLVYGEGSRFRQHARLYVLGPPVAVVAILAGREVSLLLVAVVAATWNAIHTIRQRYGLVRIYGRKVGQAEGTHEQTILFGAFLAVLALAAAEGSVTHRLLDLPIGGVNSEIARTVDRISSLAAVVALAAAAITVIAGFRWWRLEQARPRNRAKHAYLAGAAGLALALPFDPVAGLLAFAGAHAVEYAVVVHQSLGSRFGAEPSPLQRAITRRPGRLGFLVAYLAALLASMAALKVVAPLGLYVAIYLGIGALHFCYDGLIWRSRPVSAR